MGQPAFKISENQFLGEDCTISKVSDEGGQAGEGECPVVALMLKDQDFPIELQNVAANLQTMLNGNDPFPMKAGNSPVFFSRHPDGFDLHYQPQGHGITKKGLEVRIHPSAMEEDTRTYLSDRLIPDRDSSFAVRFCSAVTVTPPEQRPEKQPDKKI